MKIKVLGTDCPNCRLLEQNLKQVITERGIDAEITKENDIGRIMSYGIMRLPGLLIDEKMIISGRVPSKAEISQILTKIHSEK